jgi:NADH dehydrogenase
VPVVVTGANGSIGGALIPLLVERGGEVRAVARSSAPTDPLRSMGAKLAVCDLADTETLSVVMRGAHTVCHLAGGLDFADEGECLAANLGTVKDSLEAAAEAQISRFLFVSYPGASPGSSNVYLRAKGLAEEAVRDSGLNHVIVRCTHVYGPGSAWLRELRAAATRPLAAVVAGTGAQRLAPVFVGDVAACLAAADDRAEAVSGTFGLQGPDLVTADELADLLAGRRRRKVHLGPEALRRAARLTGRRMSPALAEILAADSLADAPDAAAEFGLKLTSLQAGLAPSS